MNAVAIYIRIVTGFAYFIILYALGYTTYMKASNTYPILAFVIVLYPILYYLANRVLY